MKMFAFLQIAREKEKAEHMETIYLSFDHLSPWVKLNCHSSGPQCIFKKIVKGAFPSNLDMIFFFLFGHWRSIKHGLVGTVDKPPWETEDLTKYSSFLCHEKVTVSFKSARLFFHLCFRGLMMWKWNWDPCDFGLYAASFAVQILIVTEHHVVILVWNLK